MEKILFFTPVTIVVVVVVVKNVHILTKDSINNDVWC